MYLFLITFLLLYGGMHLYAFYKLRELFRPRPGRSWPLILWMMVMTVLPLLVRASEQLDMEQTALYIAWPGYIWMGFLFIFSSLLFCTDLIRALYRALKYPFSSLVPTVVSQKNGYRCAFALSLAASVYAVTEAGEIRSEHVTVTTAKLRPSISRVRVVQVSDMHIGLLSQERRQKRVLDIIAEARPDILVSTGDLVDGKLNRIYGISEHKGLAALLASVPAPAGKFAVLGNHEVYAGIPQSVAFSSAAGFTVLRNRSITLENGLTITGVDDPAVNQRTRVEPFNEIALLAAAPPDSFQLLLKHRPEVPRESDGRFDLQLSGHVHNGQIFPFNFLVRLKYPIPCGTSKTKQGSRIHVSRGTGTWGPPMRLFAPPEVTIIDIVPN